MFTVWPVIGTKARWSRPRERSAWLLQGVASRWPNHITRSASARLGDTIPAMADKAIRVGFVGAGANTRKHHIPKLKAQPGVSLVAVANRSKESGEKVAREFGIGRVHAGWQEIVNASDIDAVCIGTWPYVHAEMTTAAL